MAREEKREYFASTKPLPNGPAPAKPRDDNSYYLDAPSTPTKSFTPKGYDSDDYFATPKK